MVRENGTVVPFWFPLNVPASLAMPTSLVRQGKWHNWFQLLVLVGALGCLNVLVGGLLFGRPGGWAALVLTILGAALATGISPLAVLRMYRARPLSHPDAPELCAMFGELKRRAALPTAVSLHYIHSRIPNAFAVGNSSEAAVAVTDGLLRMLTPRELAGVLAHELSHIRHNDLRVMVTADAVARVTSLFARIGFVMLMLGFPAVLLGTGIGRAWLFAGAVLFAAPVVAALLQLALSRSREFQADLGAVELTHDPRGLAMALEKIERASGEGWLRRMLGPLPDRSQPALLRSHPATQERIRRLLEIEQSMARETSTAPAPPHFLPAVRHVVPVSGDTRVRSQPAWHAGSGLWY